MRENDCLIGMLGVMNASSRKGDNMKIKNVIYDSRCELNVLDGEPISIWLVNIFGVVVIRVYNTITKTATDIPIHRVYSWEPMEVTDFLNCEESYQKIENKS